MAMVLDPQKYYRLPWSLTDNAISWLEVTSKCNLACEGCYRDPQKDGHKTLAEIADDLAVFKRERKSDCMSVAGGDPLVHPQIVEITRMIRKGGWKPILNTNGLALTESLLKDLKQAGVFGFTFHIDTSQKRKDSQAKREGDHNKLRQRLAEMLASVGNISCSFNQTVCSNTLDEIPDVVRWAIKHPDIVHSVIFILFRESRLLGDFDYYANGKKIAETSMYEWTDWAGDTLLKANDAAGKIKEVDSLYEPAAYLNGTVDPSSMKWLVATRVGTKDQTFGYVTPQFMERVQQGYRLLYNRWMSYSSPKFLKFGVPGTLVSGVFDKGMRKVMANYVKALARKPTTVKDGTYFQTFGIIQPIDAQPDGQLNMCDGCPDITVHNGKLYWSCRLEEIKEHGCYINAVPKKKSAQTAKNKPERKRPESPKPELQV